MLTLLRILKDATVTKERPEGNSELQMQTIATFAFIASRHPNEVSYGEAEKVLGLNQTTVSRNMMYLSSGSIRGHGGYDLVEVFEDQFYRRRKLCKLTPKGIKVATKLAAALVTE
jgi:DNA-binding MarR family transcriptional regulator